MVNCRRKGRFYELKAKKYFEEKGWLVQLAPNSTKWQSSQDLFGLFDLIGVKRELNISIIGRYYDSKKLYCQVKYAQTRGVLKDLQAFKNNYLGPLDTVMLLVWQPKIGFKEYICD